MFIINKRVLELTHGDSRAHASRSHLALGWSRARWIVFRSSRLGDGVLQEDLDLFSLRLFRSSIKIDSVDMLKYTHTSFMFVFGLTDFGFLVHIYGFHE